MPIIGHNEIFTYGVWASQSQESFELYKKTYHDNQSGMGSSAQFLLIFLGGKEIQMMAF